MAIDGNHNCEGCNAKDKQIEWLQKQIIELQNRFLSFVPEAMNQYQQTLSETFVPTVIDEMGEITKVDNNIENKHSENERVNPEDEGINH